MPLLPLEPFLFPDDLLRRASACSDANEQWWVLHTRPRAEKALTRKLLRQNVAFFLPLWKRQWRNRARLFCSYAPLFPGYVFVHGNSQTVFQTLTTNLVARFLVVPDQRQLNADLERVYCLIAANTPLTPEDELQPGTPVEITAGPLAGLEGKVVRRGKHLKFIVEVQFLQRGVSVEIDSWMIQPRSSSPAIPPART
jgi:transcriptional antiterminator RfaH